MPEDGGEALYRLLPDARHAGPREQAQEIITATFVAAVASHAEADVGGAFV